MHMYLQTSDDYVKESTSFVTDDRKITWRRKGTYPQDPFTSSVPGQPNKFPNRILYWYSDTYSLLPATLADGVDFAPQSDLKLIK